MIIEMCPILLILFSVYIGKSLECDEHKHKNVTCSSIKTADGYRYSHDELRPSEIFVNSNETLLAHAVIKRQLFNYSPEVIHMDNNSVTMRDCQDLNIKYMFHAGTRFVKETCVDFKMIEEKMALELLPGTSPGLIGVVFLVVIGIGIGIGIVILSCFLSWKREKKTQQVEIARSTSFLRYLLTCAGLWNRISQPQTGSEEIGLREMPSEPDPRGSGEEDAQVDALESVTVDSIDPPADGNIPESLSLDRNLSNGRIQPSKSGEIRRAPDLQAMNRNQRDDPGGVNDNKGKDTVRSREMSNGWTDPKDHESEGQPLLSTQRPAVQTSDMTGEATDLVNKRGSDPDQISRCSMAPDADVESTSNMNYCAHSG